MGGGTREIYKDDQPLATGSHEGGTGATLLDYEAQFDVFVGEVGKYVENVSRGTASTIATLTSNEITTAAGIEWQRGDTYKIYKTSAKNSKISTEWVDVSRGWQNPKETMTDGWRREDRDIDRPAGGGHRNVFGPGQPERH